MMIAAEDLVYKMYNDKGLGEDIKLEEEEDNWDSMDSEEEEDSEERDSMEEDEEGIWQEEMSRMSKVEQLYEILNRLREFKRQG